MSCARSVPSPSSSAPESAWNCCGCWCDIQGVCLSREFWGEQLWPNQACKVQRNRLRYELCQLRPFFSPTQLRTCGHDLIGLSASSDIAAFETAAHHALRLPSGPARQEALEGALSLYTGEFLPGHYAVWILDVRNCLETLHDSLLVTLSQDYNALGQPELAAYWSQKRL